MTDELIFDAWTPLSFKRSIGGQSHGGTSWMAPNWVGDHARRLRAYAMLQAFTDNAGREYLTGVGTEDKNEHREYGDAALIRDSVLSALLGEDQSIVTEGADDFNDELSPDATDAEKAASTKAKPAHDFEDWARKWATDERLVLKMIETERNAVSLGDGVYSLGWSPGKGRARLRIWDPDVYFPVLDDGNDDDYPGRIHLAWELPDPPAGKKLVRRITWDLVEGKPYTPKYADKATTIHCLLSDGTWTVGADQAKPDDFTGASVEWAMDADGEILDRDLGLDFIPVIHVPNTIAIKNHFGRATIATVLQALDDLANTDTDLQSAATTAAKPIAALKGATTDEDNPPIYAAGEIWEIGDGDLSLLDTSKALDALLKYADVLLKRIAINSRLPEAVIGRVSPSDVPSGLALALGFGPLQGMVKEMRLVRSEKNPLLHKFAWRIGIVNGEKDIPKEYVETDIKLGSFMPQDITTAVEIVTKLLVAHAISLETGIAMLVEAGLPIEDAAEEVRRIQEQDFEGAVKLLDALGNEELVAEYLRRKLPTTTVVNPERSPAKLPGAAGLPGAPAPAPTPSNPALPNPAGLQPPGQ